MEINGKMMGEVREAFEFIQGKQKEKMDITCEVWLKRVLMKVVYDVLAEKRAQE